MRIGRWSSFFGARNKVYCHKCWTSPPFVKMHVTPFMWPLGVDYYGWDNWRYGISALCEKCWDEAKPLDRINYYRFVFKSWGWEGRPMNFPGIKDLFGVIKQQVEMGW